jgi:hypothetical protein
MNVSAALNCGFGSANRRILVITDDEMRVERDWLNRIELCVASTRRGIVCARLVISKPFAQQITQQAQHQSLRRFTQSPARDAKEFSSIVWARGMGRVESVIAYDDRT